MKANIKNLIFVDRGAWTSNCYSKRL